MEWIILNQFGRRNLTAFQRGELALRLKPIIQAKAKERQGKRNELNIVQISAPSENKSLKARDELAKLAGVSHDTIEKVSTIKDKGTEEQIQRAKRKNSLTLLKGKPHSNLPFRCDGEAEGYNL